MRVAAFPRVEQPHRPRQTDYVAGFERVITTVLAVMMAIVIVLATLVLAYTLIRDFLSAPIAVLDIHEIVGVFGMFLLVLIGLELLETVRSFAREAEIRAEIIILVAIIAVARKFIILDPKETDYLVMIGAACMLLALAVTYFLVKRTPGVRTPP